MVSAWTQFVKDNYDKVRHLPVKQRFKALSELHKKGPHGGGIFSSMLGMVGLGLPVEKKRR